MSVRKPTPFLGLKESDLHAISAHAVTGSFATNNAVVSEDDRSNSHYFILSDRAKFYGSDERGKEIVLSQAGPGEYFGEISLDEGPRSASVMTLAPTRFSIVRREDLRDFRAKNPEFAFNFIGKLIHRVRVFTDSVKNLARGDKQDPERCQARRARGRGDRMINAAIVFRSTMSANGVRKIPSGCDNGDALELAQIDEIAITRDQAIRPAWPAGRSAQPQRMIQ